MRRADSSRSSCSGVMVDYSRGDLVMVEVGRWLI